MEILIGIAIGVLGMQIIAFILNHFNKIDFNKDWAGIILCGIPFIVISPLYFLLLSGKAGYQLIKHVIKPMNREQWEKLVNHKQIKTYDYGNGFGKYIQFQRVWYNRVFYVRFKR